MGEIHSDRRSFLGSLSGLVTVCTSFAARGANPVRNEQVPWSAGTTAAALGTVMHQPATNTKPIIGIQIGSVSFLDEGVDKVLDILQEKAYVNALFIASFTHGRGIAGRQIKGFPFPDHGKQEYDDNFQGGNFATPHPQFYKDTILKGTKAPDHGNTDILELVFPAAKKRGIKTYCWSEDV